jgi:hypothetical protein
VTEAKAKQRRGSEREEVRRLKGRRDEGAEVGLFCRVDC